ncbi:MAG: hypothetical protein IJH62_00195 [Mogibacterium sp.]|nr:hypothetical protein [Mogibacterium sp.]
MLLASSFIGLVGGGGGCTLPSVDGSGFDFPLLLLQAADLLFAALPDEGVAAVVLAVALLGYFPAVLFQHLALVALKGFPHPAFKSSHLDRLPSLVFKDSINDPPGRQV